jgi:Fe2+ transport system protein FeoA
MLTLRKSKERRKEGLSMKETSLADLSPGEHGTVIAMSGLPNHARQRLLEMGVTRGSRLRFVRRAPLGDPIEIHVRGYRLMLRSTEARKIFVFREKAE